MKRLIRFLPLLAVAAVLNVAFVGDFMRSTLPERRPAPAADADTVPRVVVLGFDGVDARMLQAYIDADQLPALASLARDGAFHPLMSEIPPESPVAWASLMTGVNPARHGVYDFVTPGPGYEPQNGMVDIRRARLLFDRVPLRAPRVRSRLRAPTFTELVRNAGYSVLALRQPLLFPVPDRPGAHMTPGLGTPDVAASSGFGTQYSAALGFTSGVTTFGTYRVPLPVAPPDERYDTLLYGPYDPSLGRNARGGRRRASVPLRFEVRADARVRITLAGVVQDVRVGDRSDVFSVRFELGLIPSRSVDGVVRFEVKSVDPLKVLADPVNFDPRNAPFPLSTPDDYGAKLWNTYGPYETVGWQEQTMPLNDRFQSDEDFLRDLLEDMDRGGGILMGELARNDRCVFACFTATDRACHGFYRYRDFGHRLHDDRSKSLDDPILQVFRKMDTIVGAVRARLDKDDLLLIVSDHGFQTWRWAVNINQWLVDEGYMVLKSDAEEKGLAPFFGGETGVDVVDWSKTRAYGLGLGQIYLNLRGREEQGIVDPEDARALSAEIRDKLLAIRNPYVDDARPVEGADTPVTSRAVETVTLLADVYDGPFASEAAEIQVGFAPGYRVSWQTALLGGMAKSGDVFEYNDVAWSGDHCSTSRDRVPGVLLVNRKVARPRDDRPYHVRDVAATVLRHFGLPTGELDGVPVTFPAD